ncbi:Lysophospholipase L1 [Paractinoplanes atraurantiacus]|uniref:Lysophospholipase L1 n=1 Tax=Paractinoplanes atraurantiacus TaxID=1036182 RepID=A0A285GPA8_9ACTN|nr:Lysophospholipase L1 [Actinoplanes atraurantiacus]
MLVLLVVAGIALVLRDSPNDETAEKAETAAAPVDPKTPWTGTWATVMQDGKGAGFQAETLRQVVRASIGGDSVRIRLSNEFSSAPLTVSAVYLAKHLTAGTVDPGTNAHVTFGGADSVTVKAKGTVVSDPVAFRLPAGTDLAVSAYLPQPVGSVTQHESANRDNYVASGNQSTKASLSGLRSFYNYSFLAGVDVQNPSAEGAVVALGASITDGYDSTWNENRSWHNLLARRLGDDGRTVGVLNAGISGNSMLQDGVGQSALNRLERDVLAQTGVKWVIVADLGINDLGGADESGGDRLVAGLRQLIQRSHTAKVKVLCATLVPFAGSEGYSSTGEAGRKVFNDFVRSADSGCDGVVDFDTAVHDSADPTRWNSRFDQGDHMHPNNAGMEALAAAVDTALLARATANS